MANQNRRIKRQIKAAVKKLKRGEIPYPPPPTTATTEEEAQFITEIERYRRTIQTNIQRLSADSSRAGHKKRLGLDDQLVSIEKLLNKAE